MKAWYRQNACKLPKATVDKLPTHHKVITYLYSTEIEPAITQEKLGLEQGQQDWMAEYSRQFGKFNQKIKSDPKQNAKIEKLRHQWINTGPQVAVRWK